MDLKANFIKFLAISEIICLKNIIINAKYAVGEKKIQ